MSGQGEVSDEEFARWCESLKPCRYCGEKFVGPICPCERRKEDSGNTPFMPMQRICNHLNRKPR